MHVERRAELHFAAPPVAVFPYFTPDGERAYVPGWDPRALHLPPGPEGLQTEGAVFATAADGEETFWIVLACDPAAGRARYGRFTPGSRLGTVEVECDPDGTGSVVRISYQLTALAEAGRGALEAMSASAFAATVGRWEQAIGELIARPVPSDNRL